MEVSVHRGQRCAQQWSLQFYPKARRKALLSMGPGQHAGQPYHQTRWSPVRTIICSSINDVKLQDFLYSRIICMFIIDGGNRVRSPYGLLFLFTGM